MLHHKSKWTQFVALENLQNIKRVNTFSSSSSSVLRHCHVWRSSLTFPWWPPSLHVSAQWRREMRRWGGKTAQSSSSTNTSRTHKLRFNWYGVFEVWFWYLYCSFRVCVLVDCLWLKLKKISKTERQCWTQTLFKVLWFLPHFPLSVGPSQRSPFVNRGQHLFTAERLLMFLERLSKMLSRSKFNYC